MILLKTFIYPLTNPINFILYSLANFHIVGNDIRAHFTVANWFALFHHPMLFVVYVALFNYYCIASFVLQCERHSSWSFFVHSTYNNNLKFYNLIKIGFVALRTTDTYVLCYDEVLNEMYTQL